MTSPAHNSDSSTTAEQSKPIDPQVQGVFTAIEALVASANLTLDEAVEALRTGQLAAGRTVAESIARAMTQATDGIRQALHPYVRVLVHGMPGTCACTCPDCLDVVERHRAIPDRPGEREPVPCPCREAGDCDCARSLHLLGTSCLDKCPALGDLVVASLDDEIDVVRNWVRARAQRRQLSRNQRRAKAGKTQRLTRGEHAVEQYNDAVCRMYRHAGLRIEDRLDRIEAVPNTRRPKRDHGRGLTEEQFAELIAVVWSGGGDPDLDGLLTVFEVATGARREGVLNLRTDGLDLDRVGGQLWEKAGSERWQPCPRPLLVMLIEHVIERHLAVVDATWADVSADDVLTGRRVMPSGIPVFHYKPVRRNGVLTPRPCSRRRFNKLYERVQETLPWADQHQVHGHDLRRTGSSWIERRFGRGVAKAWLGHADDVTGDYTRGTAEEVRAATDWLGALLFGHGPAADDCG